MLCSHRLLSTCFVTIYTRDLFRLSFVWSAFVVISFTHFNFSFVYLFISESTKLLLWVCVWKSYGVEKICEFFFFLLNMIQLDLFVLLHLRLFLDPSLPFIRDETSYVPTNLIIRWIGFCNWMVDSITHKRIYD